MNRHFMIIFFIVLLSHGTVFADETKNLGLGIILGEPTGLSMKKWFDNERAIDAAAAWTFEKNSSVTFYLDYLLHRYGIVENETGISGGRAPLYFGFGAKVAVGDETKIGMRIPLGINYIFTKDPIDLFIEIAPGLNIVPSSELNISGGIGIRYYIK